MTMQQTVPLKTSDVHTCIIKCITLYNKSSDLTKSVLYSEGWCMRMGLTLQARTTHVLTRHLT